MLRQISNKTKFCNVKQLTRSIHVEKKISSLGYNLTCAAPKGNYVPYIKTGNKVFLAGHLPFTQDGTLLKGKVGKDLTTKEGYDAARLVMVGLLGSLKHAIGDLDKTVKVVKVSGMVNCGPDFCEHPQVINGASDLLDEVFNKSVGTHCRVAAGFVSLPLGVPVEIDMIVEVEE